MAKLTKSPCSQKNDEKLLLVAKIGRAVGLNGGLRLHIVSDFPQIFQPKATFKTDSKHFPKLEIAHFSREMKLNQSAKFAESAGVVEFAGFDSRDLASKLINTSLFCTLAQSKQMCPLNENEFLWSELINVEVRESSEILGIVEEIERIGAIDYFRVKTSENLTKQGYAKRFLIPNIPQYILSLSTDSILTQNAKLILQES